MATKNQIGESELEQLLQTAESELPRQPASGTSHMVTDVDCRGSISAY